MPSTFKYKVGDRVLLDPKKVTRSDLSEYWADGTIGNVYTITDLHSIKKEYTLAGGNWHKEDWLTKLGENNVIGGKVNVSRKI